MLISVVTPSFNYARFLPDCLGSVRRAGVAHEHLVADNMSADGTPQLLASQRDPDLTWWSREDSGQSDALNALLASATGDILAWLNADEYYMPGALSEVTRFFSRHPEVDVLFGDTAFVDVGGRFLRLLSRYPHDPFVLRHRGCYISTCATFVRRSALEGFQFDTSLRSVMDWDFYLHLQGAGATFAYSPQVFAAFRAHDARVTAQPIPRTSVEHLRVRQRYDLTTSSLTWPIARRAGDLRHRLHKQRSGGFRRERLARPLMGSSLLWAADGGDQRQVEAIVANINRMR